MLSFSLSIVGGLAVAFIVMIWNAPLKIIFLALSVRIKLVRNQKVEIEEKYSEPTAHLLKKLGYPVRVTDGSVTTGLNSARYACYISMQY